MAIGAELRRDSYLDDRDERVDGTMTWPDSVTGFEQPSDLFGVSPTPDTQGSRTVFAVYAELAVPLARKSVVWGKSVSIRVALVFPPILTQKNTQHQNPKQHKHT